MITESLTAFSQTITFQKYYDTLGCYYSNSVFQNIDNGFILCGSSYHAATAQQAAIIRTDSLGNIIWVKEYGAASTDGALSCVLTNDSNILVVGIKDQYSITDGKIWFMKLSQNGNIMWSHELKIQSGRNQPEEVSKCKDNGFIISGFCNTQLISDAIPFALRIDSSGNVVWSQTYGYSVLSAFHSGVQSPEGGFVFTGEIPSGTASDIFLVKTDSAGDTLWTRKFGNANVDVGSSVRILDDSSIVVAGSTYDTTGWDIYLTLLDQNGSMIWKKTLGNHLENTAHSLQLTMDGALLVCGTTQSMSSNYQALLMKLDMNGDTIWSNTYGDTQSDIAYYAIQCRDSGYALLGKSDYLQTHGAMYFVKINENGQLNFILDNYSKETFFEIFPNPASGSLTIKFGPEMYDGFDVVITDITGKLCSQFYKYQNASPVDISDLVPGVYNIYVFDKNRFYSKLFVKY